VYILRCGQLIYACFEPEKICLVVDFKLDMLIINVLWIIDSAFDRNDSESIRRRKRL